MRVWHDLQLRFGMFVRSRRTVLALVRNGRTRKLKVLYVHGATYVQGVRFVGVDGATRYLCLKELEGLMVALASGSRH